jgi:hypothetical protein
MDLIIGFIDHLEVVLQTTVTLPLFPNLQITVTHPSVLSVRVPTIRFLATDFNTGIVTVSLNYTLKISLCYRTCKVYSAQPTAN